MWTLFECILSISRLGVHWVLDLGFTSCPIWKDSEVCRNAQMISHPTLLHVFSLGQAVTHVLFVGRHARSYALELGALDSAAEEDLVHAAAAEHVALLGRRLLAPGVALVGVLLAAESQVRVL